MKTEFTSRDVIALTRITPRQLQWWDERGVVVPDRRGHKRIYSLEDLSEVAVICELRRRGFSLQRVRRVIELLQRQFGSRLAETITEASNYHLLTDGRTLYLETSPQQIVDILENANQPMLAIGIRDALRHVRAGILEGKKRSGSVAGLGPSRRARRKPAL